MEILESLGIDWKMLLAQAVNFGILVFVLAKFVLKPLMKSVDQRQAEIKESERNAEKISQQLEEARIAQDSILKEARNKSETILKDAEKSAAALRKGIVEDAKTEAARVVAAGEKKLEEDKRKFFTSMKNDLAEIVALSVEKTVGRYVTPEMEAKLSKEAAEIAHKMKDNLASEK